MQPVGFKGTRVTREGVTITLVGFQGVLRRSGVPGSFSSHVMNTDAAANELPGPAAWWVSTVGELAVLVTASLALSWS